MDAAMQRRLLEAARAAAQHAYAPYSRFSVGAAILCADGTIITGANVENASYGLTVCAERVALAAAVSQGHRAFEAVAVWADQCPQGSVTPCGACRQVLAEFLPLHHVVIAAHPQTGEPVATPLEALLPAAFSGAPLPGKDSKPPGAGPSPG